MPDLTYNPLLRGEDGMALLSRSRCLNALSFEERATGEV